MTQQINFWQFKRALSSGPYCTFRPKIPNRCTKNGRFAKHLKKNCFFGNEKFKNLCLEKYKYQIVKECQCNQNFGYKFDVESPIYLTLLIFIIFNLKTMTCKNKLSFETFIIFYLLNLRMLNIYVLTINKEFLYKQHF